MDEKAQTGVVIDLARALGLSVYRAERIGGYANALYRLHPLPLVARVAGPETMRRGGCEWMAQELRVARHLASRGVQATSPATLCPPGPHRHAGEMITFWQFLPTVPDRPSPRRVGRELALLHAALADFEDDLPLLAPLEESWQIFDRLLVGEPILAPEDLALTRERIARVRDRLAGEFANCRPLHGDPHHGNLLATPEGWAWSDFEDACRGPVEWDIASAIASSVVLGTGAAARDVLAALDIGPDPELLDTMIEARTLMGMAWALVAGTRPASDPRMRSRLDWLATRG